MEMLEVEIKAEAKIEEIKRNIKGMRACFIKKEIQEDTYFHHPCRDFKAKDEALRVREVEGAYFLTYKGKKQDSETKTRPEIETKVGKTIFDILKNLGFSEARKILKKRYTYRWDRLKIHLDRVEGLGEYVEVEGGALKDKEKMARLLKGLGIPERKLIRKSYLEMLEES